MDSGGGPTTGRRPFGELTRRRWDSVKELWEGGPVVAGQDQPFRAPKLNRGSDFSKRRENFSEKTSNLTPGGEETTKGDEPGNRDLCILGEE